MGSYGFFELINTLGVTVPMSHHWPMGDVGKQVMLQVGGGQIRPLTPVMPLDGRAVDPRNCERRASNP